MEILKIAKLIEERGGRLYLVGGAIRDKLLNKDISDEDYSVTGLTGKEFEELFPKAITRRKIF
jgi:tRNA nucleotidyltransferase (CCA-adding enzyme)